MNTVITGTIHEGNFESLKQIMRDQSSCKRYAYQRIHKDALKGNDIKIACKPLYMNKLNQKYISDVVLGIQRLITNILFLAKKELEETYFRANVNFLNLFRSGKDSLGIYRF